MFTILSRIFHFGFKNFWRNGWLSAATVAVMVLALSVFAALILFGVVTEKAIATIQDKIDISVYFKTTTPEDQILSIKQSIESLPEVKSTEYVSRDRALEIFKEKHKDDPTIIQALAELSSNPLQASLNVKANNPDHYATIAQYFSDNNNLSQYIDSVSYYKNQVVIDRLSAIVRGVNRAGLLLTIVLALIGCLMVFSTIQLATYSNRDEISIMRVVGASNALVRGPFVVQGIMSGLVAGVVSLLVVGPVTYFAAPQLDKFIPGLDLFRYFATHIGSLLLYQMMFGVFLGAVSSFVAVRRYLKN